MFCHRFDWWDLLIVMTDSTPNRCSGSSTIFSWTRRLAALDADGNVTTKAPRGSEEADVWPLLGEGLAGDKLAAWLAERIDEVETAIGRLPSIAVFVDGDDPIDPLVTATQRILAERNIPIVGCKEGRVVGDAREVRVFDIQHIKGLEFEAVFFVGIDGLARRIPDLFQRFFYRRRDARCHLSGPYV